MYNTSMPNIKLTNEEYYELMGSVDINGIGTGVVRLFGFPVFRVEDGFVLYSKCEYCGQVKCRCGAPLDWQGKRIERAPTDDLTTAIIKELIKSK